MSNKISASILLCAMTVSAVIIIITVSAVSDRKRAEAVKASDLPAITKIVETASEVGYYLREYNGELAVFRGHSDTPFKRLGVGLEYMTDEDKLILKEGIYAENERKLKMLIEDYTS